MVKKRRINEGESEKAKWSAAYFCTSAQQKKGRWMRDEASGENECFYRRTILRLPIVMWTPPSLLRPVARVEA